MNLDDPRVMRLAAAIIALVDAVAPDGALATSHVALLNVVSRCARASIVRRSLREGRRAVFVHPWW